jgi:hypothetical protein
VTGKRSTSIRLVEIDDLPSALATSGPARSSTTRASPTRSGTAQPPVDRREVAAWLGDAALTVVKTYRNVLVNTPDNISDSLREGVNVRQVGP